MSPDWNGRWLTDKAAFELLVERARARYEPVVSKLPPWELAALLLVVGERVAVIKAERDEEDAKRDGSAEMDLGRTLAYRQYTEDMAT